MGKRLRVAFIGFNPIICIRSGTVFDNSFYWKGEGGVKILFFVFFIFFCKLADGSSCWLEVVFALVWLFGDQLQRMQCYLSKKT